MTDDATTGTVREPSGELVRQAHGGALRRGGGAPPRSDDQARAHRLLREGAEDAARTLLTAARNGDVKAAGQVLAYALGRPAQRVELDGTLTTCGHSDFVATLTDEERRILRRAIDAELRSRDDRGGEAAGAATG